MKYKIIDFESFTKYFQAIEPETGLGIEFDHDTRENYLFYQTFIPKSFLPFDLQNPSDFGTFEIMMNRTATIPDKLFFKFELFGRGKINGQEMFIFRPWVINVQSNFATINIEQFHLFLPSFFLDYLIDQYIFLEVFQWDNIKNIRVLKDLKIKDEEIGNKDYTPFEYIRTKNLNQMDIDFKNILNQKEIDIIVENKYYERYRDYFE